MSIQPQQRLVEILSSLLIQVNALQAQADPAESSLSTGLHTLEQLTRDALVQARTLCTDEQADELKNTTLAEALTQMVESTAEMLDLSSRISLSGTPEQGRPGEHNLPQQAERILYLAAREALYRVQQHNDAHRIRLVLNYGSEQVEMSIEDDGTGSEVGETPEDILDTPFSAGTPPAISPHTRTYNTAILNDLRYRLEALGGTLVTEQGGERGTRVTARVPYTPHVHEYTSEPLPTEQASPIAAPQTSASEHITILLVDSQAVTRAGLRSLLETFPGLHVIGEAVDDVQAVSEALELGPQVVLMDTQLPNGQSIEALRRIKQLNQETRVLLLSTQDREEYLYETLRAGADGYVLKDIAPAELVAAIQAVARGEVLVQSQLAGRLLSRVGRVGANYSTLTARELEVLRLLAKGLRNKEIAAQLFVSERTVNFHLANIYQKLNVSGRTEALRRAIDQGLITA